MCSDLQWLLYVGRFVSDLGVSEGIDRRARELLRVAKDEEVHVGKSPVGLAAAAVYAATLEADERSGAER